MYLNQSAFGGGTTWCNESRFATLHTCVHMMCVGSQSTTRFASILAHGLVGSFCANPATQNLMWYVFWMGALRIFGVALAMFGFRMPMAGNGRSGIFPFLFAGLRIDRGLHHTLHPPSCNWGQLGRRHRWHGHQQRPVRPQRSVAGIALAFCPRARIALARKPSVVFPHRTVEQPDSLVPPTPSSR
jgi:hypothetical protein